MKNKEIKQLIREEIKRNLLKENYYEYSPEEEAALGVASGVLSDVYFGDLNVNDGIPEEFQKKLQAGEKLSLKEIADFLNDYLGNYTDLLFTPQIVKDEIISLTKAEIRDKKAKKISDEESISFD